MRQQCKMESARARERKRRQTFLVEIGGRFNDQLEMFDDDARGILQQIAPGYLDTDATHVTASEDEWQILDRLIQRLQASSSMHMIKHLTDCALMSIVHSRDATYIGVQFQVLQFDDASADLYI